MFSFQKETTVKLQGYAIAFAASLALSTMPVLAADEMGEAPIDCSTAAAHMQSMMMTPPSMPGMSGAGVDKTFAMGAQEMLHRAMLMARMEMKCGKNSKEMKDAHKIYEDAEQYMFMLHNLGSSF